MAIGAIVTGILGRAVIPAAAGALGLNNAEKLMPEGSEAAANIPMTGDWWIDGLAILAAVSRFAYVKVKQKRGNPSVLKNLKD